MLKIILLILICCFSHIACAELEASEKYFCIIAGADASKPSVEVIEVKGNKATVGNGPYDVLQNDTQVLLIATPKEWNLAYKIHKASRDVEILSRWNAEPNSKYIKLLDGRCI